jgi:hypothetical protein
MLGSELGLNPVENGRGGVAGGSQARVPPLPPSLASSRRDLIFLEIEVGLRHDLLGVARQLRCDYLCIFLDQIMEF